MRGRRLLVLAGLTATMVVLATMSSAQAATTRVNCSQKAITILFWARGHQAIPSVGFPQFLLPHLEVYKTANSYPNANTLAVVQADGGTGVATRCTPAGKRRARKFEDDSKRTTKQTALRCKSRKAAQLEVVGEPGKSGTLRVWYGSMLGVVAKMLQTGSVLTFDRGYCSPYPLPR